MPGHRQPFAAVPFFWSQRYGVQINYVDHAESWDELDSEGARSLSPRRKSFR